MNASKKQEIEETVSSEFWGYETALVSNNVEALQGYFHESPDAIRYGVSEQLYGHEEIAQFRKNRVINFRNRTKKRFEITVLAENVANTMYEYSVELDGVLRHGRQSQTWVYLNGSWKIMTAHVSLLPRKLDEMSWAEYANQASSALGFEIAPSHMAGVVQNLNTMNQLMTPLMDFELPDTIEPAPVFRP